MNLENLSKDLLGYTIDNRYHIESFLGEGGFGAVFLGHHIILGEPIRDVAIKIIKQEIPIGKEKEIFSEAIMQVTADANMADDAKDRIVQIYDFGLIEEKGRIGYIIMELIDGGDLGSELKAFCGPMPENIANKYIAEIAKGIAGLHALEKPIIHRDLKPDNVLLTKEKKIKIADFGLAARLNNAYHFAEGVAGTQLYMAPETLVGAYAYTQSDIFCIGVIWYQLLTNKFPFDDDITPNGKEDENAAKWRYEQRKKVKPKSPTEWHNNTCSEETERMIYKCLRFTHTERYRNAKELFDALQQKKMSRQDYFDAAIIAFEKKDFSAALSNAEAGISLNKNKNDALQFKLKHVMANTCKELGNFEDAARLYTELRLDNDKSKRIYLENELIELYENECVSHEKMGHNSKVNILTKKIKRLKSKNGFS
ncbi:MAG: serine/threonine protein kinase [Calditrichaeota bacterium]|nr:MAG: serine/threonine protein kinase [Calditrichota bacterium]